MSGYWNEYGMLLNICRKFYVYSSPHICFSSGGISIKPAANMDLMRGDMGGAATVAGAMVAISTLQLPINVVGLIPLCENLINGQANKPGDVVRAMNGKTIQVSLERLEAWALTRTVSALCHPSLPLISKWLQPEWSL